MTQLREPNLPAVGKTPDEQRMLGGLRDIIRGLLREGIFLTRSGVERSSIIRPTTNGVGKSYSLAWGKLNRVELAANATVLLPPIESAWIGVPLYVAKLSVTGTLSLVPSGFALGSHVRPKVNNTTSIAVNSAGLNVLITDGLNWYARAS